MPSIVAPILSTAFRNTCLPRTVSPCRRRPTCPRQSRRRERRDDGGGYSITCTASESCRPRWRPHLRGATLRVWRRFFTDRRRTFGTIHGPTARSIVAFTDEPIGTGEKAPGSGPAIRDVEHHQVAERYDRPPFASGTLIAERPRPSRALLPSRAVAPVRQHDRSPSPIITPSVGLRNMYGTPRSPGVPPHAFAAIRRRRRLRRRAKKFTAVWRILRGTELGVRIRPGPRRGCSDGAGSRQPFVRTMSLAIS